MDIVEQAVMSVHTLSEERRITIRISASRPGAVNADLNRIVQVLTNLLSNALKFSPEGGEVELSVTRDGGRIRFSVSDYGEGVPEESVGRLFQKFQQLDSSDARRGQGTGPGLAISKAIVELHGGVIGVNTTYGKGSPFWFELDEVAEPHNGPLAAAEIQKW